ncbi:hypothetical protein CMT77_05235 [Elizabethkingia anophelis]|nr:hypothetical protein [Elizabethkingia anophelis]MDV3955024.1 hypothetical protein [Elizabethkingia anophelis]
MNRIILIGNGFDLAHGMKTGYNDFINDFWKQTCERIKDINTIRHIHYNDNYIKIREAKIDWEDISDYKTLKEVAKRKGKKITFNNNFLKIITENCHSYNWGGIENEYYNELKRCYGINNEEDANKEILKLNREFEELKKLLELYLIKIEKDFNEMISGREDILTLKKNIHDVIYSEFDLKDFNEDSINELANIEYNIIKKNIAVIKDESNSVEINDIYDQQCPNDNKKIALISLLNKCNNDRDYIRKIRELLINEKSKTLFEHIPNEILFLNFNYTTTETLYVNPIRYGGLNKPYVDTIHIHGELNNNRNKMIFGFGDELDKDYADIENLNNNEYLKNIKSIQYFESDSYKRLLDYINKEQYQIFIFGHSCANSDRTLLNTLFEHKNCKSIKNYYYHNQVNDWDNFNDITMNISRSFTNKADMRDKVVNKKYCTALFN